MYYFIAIFKSATINVQLEILGQVSLENKHN